VAHSRSQPIPGHGNAARVKALGRCRVSTTTGHWRTRETGGRQWVVERRRPYTVQVSYPCHGMAFRSPAIRAVCVTCPTSSHMQTQDVLLSFEGGDMIMRDGATNEQIEHWPIRYLREYSQKGKRVSFEAGRRCPKGQGIFFFDVERTVNFVKAMDNHIDMIEANDKAATAKPVPPPLRSTPGQRPSNSSARQTSSATSSDRRPQLKGRVPPGHSAVGAAPVTYINVDVGELGKEQHTDLNYSMIEPQKKKQVPHGQAPHHQSQLGGSVQRKLSSTSTASHSSVVAAPTESSYVAIDMMKTQALENAFSAPPPATASKPPPSGRGKHKVKEARATRHDKKILYESTAVSAPQKASTQDIIDDVDDLLADLDMETQTDPTAAADTNAYVNITNTYVNIGIAPQGHAYETVASAKKGSGTTF